MITDRKRPSTPSSSSVIKAARFAQIGWLGADSILGAGGAPVGRGSEKVPEKLSRESSWGLALARRTLACNRPSPRSSVPACPEIAAQPPPPSRQSRPRVSHVCPILRVIPVK
jgi:hypothetical protein